MRVSVSNLAWCRDDEAEVFPFLKSVGVNGIEVAPGMIDGWDSLDEEIVKDYGEYVRSFGLRVSSLQAIHYGLKDASLVRSDEEFLRLHERTNLAARYGSLLTEGSIFNMVFGSPKTRQTVTADWSTIIHRLRILAQSVVQHGASIVLEPCPLYYGGHWGREPWEVSRAIVEVDSANFGGCFDTACVALSGYHPERVIEYENIQSVMDHLHISMKDLAPYAWRSPENVEVMRRAAVNWIVLEQKQSDLDTLKSSVDNFLKDVNDAVC